MSGGVVDVDSIDGETTAAAHEVRTQKNAEPLILRRNRRDTQAVGPTTEGQWCELYSGEIGHEALVRGPLQAKVEAPLPLVHRSRIQRDFPAEVAQLGSVGRLFGVAAAACDRHVQYHVTREAAVIGQA